MREPANEHLDQALEAFIAVQRQTETAGDFQGGKTVYQAAQPTDSVQAVRAGKIEGSQDRLDNPDRLIFGSPQFRVGLSQVARGLQADQILSGNKL